MGMTNYQKFGILVLALSIFNVVVKIALDAARLIHISNWIDFFLVYLLFINFKKPLLNGVYRMIFIAAVFSFISDILGLCLNFEPESPIIFKICNIMMHFPHCIGFILYMKRFGIKSNRSGIYLGLAFIFFVISGFWWLGYELLEIKNTVFDYIYQYMGLYDDTHILFLFAYAFWFVFNYLEIRIRNREEFTYYHLQEKEKKK